MFDCDGLFFNFKNSSSRSVLTHDDNFVFGHYKVGPGIATICGGLINSKLYYGIALCSPDDNFSKSEGRERAIAHLVDDEHSCKRGVMTLQPEDCKGHPTEILKKAVERHLKKIDKRHKPQWAKNAEVGFRGKPRKRKGFNDIKGEVKIVIAPAEKMQQSS
jgi:hypothetical protein